MKYLMEKWFLVRDWIQFRPSGALGWHSVGKAYEDENLLAHALLAYRQAARLDPEMIDVWICLGRVHERAAQMQDAVAQYAQFNKGFCREGEGQSILENSRRLGNQRIDAANAYRQVLRIEPQRTQVWWKLATIYKATGQVELATDSYENGLKYGPEDATAWYNLGVLLDESGQKERAKSAYSHAVRNNPAFTSAWINLGCCHMLEKQTEKGVDAFDRASRLAPENAEIWHLLGQACLAGRSTPNSAALIKKALASLSEAVRIDPKRVRSIELLLACCMLDGSKARACEVFDQLLRVDPERAESFLAGWETSSATCYERGSFLTQSNYV